MKVSYTLQGKKKTIEMPINSTIEDLLLKININPETVLVKVDDTFTPELDKLKTGKTYKILRVGSQG